MLHNLALVIYGGYDSNRTELVGSGRIRAEGGKEGSAKSGGAAWAASTL